MKRAYFFKILFIFFFLLLSYIFENNFLDILNFYNYNNLQLINILDSNNIAVDIDLYENENFENQDIQQHTESDSIANNTEKIKNKELADEETTAYLGVFAF